MILTDTMGKTFDGLFATANEGIDVVVEPSGGIEGDFTDVHRRIDASVLDEIRAVDGVSAASGSIDGFAQLVRADGSVGSLDGIGQTLGTMWVEDERLNPFDLRSGHGPEAADEVVLDQATFEDEGWALGDRVTVLANGGPTELTIAGTAAFGAAEGVPGFSLVAVGESTAQLMFGEAGKFDLIVVAGDGDVTPDELAARIGTAVGSADVEVITGEADTADKQAEFKEDMEFFNTFLLSFAYIALFVGMFIIYNTFSIVIAQRMREMAMLRAIGASRRQVLRSVLFESVLIGGVASGVGLGTGVLMSFGLRALLGGVGLDIPDGDLVISSGTVITAFTVGTLVTLVSSLGPALRAGRIRPIAALRDVAVERSGATARRTVLGLGVVGVGIALAGAGMAGDGKAAALSSFGFGALLIVLGLFVLGPVIARPVMHVLGTPVPRVSGATGHLARENAKRNPRRTAATASALMVGVFLVGFITIFASSTKASMGDAVDESLRADYVVASGAWGQGGFSPVIEDDLRALPEVEAITPVRVAPVQSATGTTELLSVDTATVDQLIDVGVLEGAVADVHGDGVAVDNEYATENGIGLGDTVTLTFASTGAVDLTVQALYDSDLLGAGDNGFVVGLDTFEANVADQFDREVYVAIHDDVDAATSAAAIETALERWPNAELQDQAAFKEDITSEIDMMLNLIYGLLALAVVIALIGIANTLALSVHERTRELGLLRAVGMTRRQLRTAIRWESVLISLLGTALGFALAFGTAWGMTQVLRDDVTAFVVPGGQLAVIVVLAAFAGVLASLGPARRAARLNVLDAIATH
jgi:putative ABC transport system permease protein